MDSPTEGCRLVAGFDLKAHGWAVDVDHAGGTADAAADKRRGQMLQINVRSDTEFPFGKRIGQQFQGGVLQEPDQPGRCQHSGQTGKADRVRRFDRERGPLERPQSVTAEVMSLVQAKELCG